MMQRNTAISHHNIEQGKHTILLKVITNMGGSAASPINYNLFISVPLMVVSFRDGL